MHIVEGQLSSTKCTFAGISVEGTIITTRDTANQAFYGRALTAKQLLLGGAVGQPTAAKPLYGALHELMDRMEEPMSAAVSARWLSTLLWWSVIHRQQVVTASLQCGG